MSREDKPTNKIYGKDGEDREARRGGQRKEKMYGIGEGDKPGDGLQGAASHEHDSVILEELRKLRQEHAEAVGDNKRAMARLEKNIKEVMERTTSLEQRAGHMEERIGETEDRTARLERSAVFLLQQTAKMSAKCDDLESRMRSNNIRIHGIPEGAEKNDTIGFITGLIKSKKTCVNVLILGFCVQWECVHSPFTPRSAEPTVDAGFSYLTSVRFGSAQLLM